MANKKLNNMEMPALKIIGEDFNCMGNKDINEYSLPNLEKVGGRLIIADSGFTKLPPKLREVGGDVIISRNDPVSLLFDLQEAKQNGIIKGDLYFCD